MKVPALRSPHDQVEGLYYFGRMLDKIRLHAAEQLPEVYHANLGLGFDARILSFLWVEYPALAARVKEGGSDEEVLAWCYERGRKPNDEEIEIWNEFMRKRGWEDEATATLLKRKRESGFEHRDDIQTMFDYIDADEERELRK